MYRQIQKYILKLKEAVKKVPPLVVRPLRPQPPLLSLVVIGTFFIVYRALKNSFSLVVRPLPNSSPPLLVVGQPMEEFFCAFL